MFYWKRKKNKWKPNKSNTRDESPINEDNITKNHLNKTQNTVIENERNVESEGIESISITVTEINDNNNEIISSETTNEPVVDSNIIHSVRSSTGTQYSYSEVMVGKNRKYKCEFNGMLCSFNTSYLKDLERHFRCAYIRR